MRARTSRSDILFAAYIVYIIGVWLHIPYGGGHIYSDLSTVFQEQECLYGVCHLQIPYVQTFIEYPVIVSFFIYAMGLIGTILPFPILNGYYIASVVVLSVPSILLVDETMKVAKLIGADERRALKYIAVTPTFLFLLLVNWYMIGVYFAMLGLRMFLEGKRTYPGVFFGLSAASNVVTAAPAIGLAFSLRSIKEVVKFAGSAGLTFLALNIPFVIINSQLWLQYWQFQSSWYVEGSWMLAFIGLYSPLRHIIFPVLAVALLGIIFALSRTSRGRDPLTLAWLSTFALLFSSYVFTPQMNLIILPFFALIPIAKRYWEFLAFDILSAAVILVGFSQPLQIFGITWSINQFTYWSPIQWMAIIRSFWLGKFLIWDGFVRILSRRAISINSVSTEIMKMENWMKLRLQTLRG